MSQKRKLEEYLKILEDESEDIVKSDADKLVKHIELEKNIISELSSFKKILDPLEKIYTSLPDSDMSITELRVNIEKLSGHVQEKSLENRDKLEVLLSNVKTELKQKSKDTFSKSVIHEVHSNLVDVNG